MFSFSESWLAGSGKVDIHAGSVFSLTAGDLEDNQVVPVLSAEGLETSDLLAQPKLFAPRTLLVNNDGSVEIASGASSDRVVEFRGNA